MMTSRNFSIRSIIVTGVLIGSLGVSGLVSVVTNPVGPVGASEKPAISSGSSVTGQQSEDSAANEALKKSSAANTLKIAQSDVRPVSPSVVENAAGKAAPQAGIATDENADAKLPGQSKVFGVNLASDGLLPGRLNVFDAKNGTRKPATRLSIYFLKRGNVIAHVKPGVGGIFQVDGLPLGVCSMIAHGEDGFFACALLVRPALDPKIADATATDEDYLQIDADVVHPMDVPLVRLMIRERLFPSASIAAEVDDAKRNDRLSQRGKPFRTPTLKLQNDGTLQARLNWIHPDSIDRLPVTDAVAYAIRDGVIAGKAEADPNGICTFSKLSPGAYSMLVVPVVAAVPPSPDNEIPKPVIRGYAATGVIVVEPPKGNEQNVDARQDRNPIRLVSAIRLLQAVNELHDIDLVPMEDIFGSTTGPMDAGPIAGGAGGGAPPVGGGGGGGGGDLTPLLFAGGIAGLLAATANNNNGTSTTTVTTTSGGGGSGGGGGGGGGGGVSPKSTQ